MTRYQIHVYLTSNNQRLRSSDEFQTSDPTSKRPCCNTGVLCKFRVIEGQNTCVQITSDRRLFGLSVSSPIHRNNQNTRRKTKESFLSTLVKSWPLFDVECPAILSLRSLGYFLERTLVSLYDATVADVSPSLLRTFYFLHHDGMKMCLSVVSLLWNVPCGVERGEMAIFTTGGGGSTSLWQANEDVRWMGSHFHDWIDDNGVAFSIELEWGRLFPDFLG